MRGWDIAAFSDVYSVRRLGTDDVKEILALCRSNPQYYAYCGKEASAELIEQDLVIVPPGIPAEQKYYIGFFMLHGRLQGRGIGSKLMAEVFAYLRAREIRRCRLGIDKDNPQSNHFWKKNGFAVIREVERDNGMILLAEKKL